ncbi:hypothetical protein DQW50_15090 [Halorubrum sp. 48-1-W]|uniref:hypothetical protein n=1 Tax=Halorubrum sp. 48-1-W TaxID=2249761 RepID=UPI000DCF02ED|nr:hypothetical protein [Halorubrum sp. 48-1-W]RAW44314.1 hypothetical protein DQW50_15090 [Halorubrum sp. 48-1-W]
MTDPRITPVGSTLIVGPSGAGKTRATARALEDWLDERGPRDTVVFEFGPELERDGRVVGGRLDRFMSIPDDVWVGRVDANAPRSQGETPADVLALARENAERANRRFDAAPPDPTAVFVNDATIAFQHESGALEGFLAYCDGADRVVVNAYEGDEFGSDNAVSRRERAVLRRLRAWADRTIELE